MTADNAYTGDGYLQGLNPQQRQAVEYCGGPQLVIAGAGSGKTRVLTYKIVHLLRLGYEPWRILALTFTNKAAREMRERIEALTGPAVAAKLWMGTFHSIFARILRQNAALIGYSSSFTIYDAADSKALVKLIVKELGLDEKVYKPSTVQSAISTAKNALLSPDDYRRDRDLMELDRKARRDKTYLIYDLYVKRCRVAGAMDFDDLLYYTDQLLRRHPDVRRHYQEFFRYVLVDEYQDTNYAQHAIVRQLCEGQQHLCVVGDDAQSIYSFRGANIRNILEMRIHYPSLATHKLERNYRSTQNIIDAAGSLIKKNAGQIPKEVYSENDRGPLIDVVRCYSDYEEASQVAGRITQVKRRDGTPYSATAILYRTNAQSRVLEESLRKRNVPYRIYGGLSFYQRKEVKDALAYFRLALNPHDDEALRRVINYPARGIGDTTVKRLGHTAIESGVSLWDVITRPDEYPSGVNAGSQRKLQAFAALIQGFATFNDSAANAYSTADRIIRDTQLYTVLLHDRTPESISKQENIQELLKGVMDFVEVQQEQGAVGVSLADYMASVSLATDQDTDGGEDAVVLMTVHAAKGLEFDNVFIVGAEEDLFPSTMGGETASGIEEERRLMYVAITRARRYCMITYAGQRYRNGTTVYPRPSRFIGDIDPCYMHFDTGGDFEPAPRRERPARIQPSRAVRLEGGARPLNALRDTPAGNSATLHTLSRALFGESGAVAPAAAATPAVTAGDGYRPHRPDEVKVGQSIRHSKFGNGLVEDIDTSGQEPRMTVAFENDSVPTRTLLFKFAKFIKL